MPSESIFFACWVSTGEWEVRLDGPHQPNGKRHVHVRRKRGRKGEYSWNEDGSRHDKYKFPVNEGMIGKAKDIAASKLGIPIGSLELLTGLPRGGCIVILHDGLPCFSETCIFGESGLIVLVSADWLILVAPDSNVEQLEEESNCSGQVKSDRG